VTGPTPPSIDPRAQRRVARAARRAYKANSALLWADTAKLVLLLVPVVICCGGAAVFGIMALLDH
jgi:hypothetical protein